MKLALVHHHFPPVPWPGKSDIYWTAEVRSETETAAEVRKVGVLRRFRKFRWFPKKGSNTTITMLS